MNKLLANNDFYNEIASEYDEMISFNSAVESKKNLLKKFINDNTKTVADIGCGSGVDSIALSKLGMNVFAFDPSVKMLRIAKSNAERMKIKIHFHNYPAEKIPKEYDNNFDMVVSFGNTFANISEDILLDSFRRCFDLLKPNGSLLIQILNYFKILELKERLINITESPDKIFIRFYHFIENRVIFNILSFNKEDFTEKKFSSTEIYPHQSENIELSLTKAGFKTFKIYSNLELEKFDRYQSKDLIIKADKD